MHVQRQGRVLKLRFREVCLSSGKSLRVNRGSMAEGLVQSRRLRCMEMRRKIPAGDCSDWSQYPPMPLNRCQVRQKGQDPKGPALKNSVHRIYIPVITLVTRRILLRPASNMLLSSGSASPKQLRVIRSWEMPFFLSLFDIDEPDFLNFRHQSPG